MNLPKRGTLNHIDRTKMALRNTLTKMKDDIEMHRSTGTEPAGLINFCNGVILAKHVLDGSPGDAPFIQVRVDLQKKAKLALETVANVVAEQEYQDLVVDVLEQVRVVLWTEADVSDMGPLQATLIELGKRTEKLDLYVSSKMAEAGMAESRQGADAPLQAQEGSIPSPAAPTVAHFNGS